VDAKSLVIIMPLTFLRLPSTSYVVECECNVCMKINRYRFVLMRYGFIDAALKNHNLCEEFFCDILDVLSNFYLHISIYTVQLHLHLIFLSQ